MVFQLMLWAAAPSATADAIVQLLKSTPDEDWMSATSDFLWNTQSKNAAVSLFTSTTALICSLLALRAVPKEPV
jgi:hypothetical protein